MSSGVIDPKPKRTGLLNIDSEWAGKAGNYLWDKYGQPIVNAVTLPGDVYAGTVDPKSDEGIGRAFDLAGMMTLGAGAMPSEGTVNMGIKAFHGSPHDFDKFSMDKIGTGEGAQVYGHGLYFAENEGVAKGYRDALTVDPRDEVNKMIEGARNMGGATFDDVKKGEVAKRLGLSDDQIRDVVTAVNGHDNGAVTDEALRAFQRLDRSLPAKPKGSMYQVDINADPEHFLDWDKPLFQQSPHVQQSLQGMGFKTDPQRVWKVEETKGGNFTVRNHWGESVGTFKSREAAEAKATAGMTDADAHGGMGVYSQLGGNTAYGDLDKGEASRKLNEAGIPGIKYLDQGSRTAGDGSRNFVVFDDKLISIAKKYGWVPGMAVPAAMMLELQGGQDKPKGPEA